MKIIICGAGEVGFSLAKYLASEDMQVTVIDDNINGQPICYDTSPGFLNVINPATGGSEDFTYVVLSFIVLIFRVF